MSKAPQPAPETELPAPPAPAAKKAPAKSTGAPWLVVVLALVFGLLCLAVAGAVLWSERGGDEVVDDGAQVRASALEAARERTVALTSYDHRTLDEDVAAVLTTATGAFEQEYASTVEQLRETFVTSQVVATAEVKAAGLEGEVADTEQGERAVVVVAVDQVIAAAGAEPRTETNRLRMTLVRPQDTWLVEAVERL